jgi:HD-GYP domain-containing protein (c-di-GMP phosphodiesterase class II)
MDYETKLKQLEILLSVSSLINSSLDPAEIRSKTVEAIVKLLNAEEGSLLLIDKKTEELFFDVATGEKGGRLKQIRLKKGEGIAGWVAEMGKPVIVNDVMRDERFANKFDHETGFVTRTVICVPIRARDRVIGVLQGINKRDGLFSENDIELITSLAGQVAIAVENASLYTELKETFYDTAETLAEIIELRDPYTGGHTRRVMNYSIMIGSRLGLNKQELEHLRLAAILHDIGKIGVGDHVLLKNSPLDNSELEKMNLHSVYGGEILSRIRQLKDIIPIVRGHHERCDGKGYPDGLKKDEILLTTRILSVADTFDAMTTDRPYRKGLNLLQAEEELKRCSGTQFDPLVVDAFRDALKEGELNT